MSEMVEIQMRLFCNEVREEKRGKERERETEEGKKREREKKKRIRRVHKP